MRGSRSASASWNRSSVAFTSLRHSLSPRLHTHRHQRLARAHRRAARERLLQVLEQLHRALQHRQLAALHQLVALHRALQQLSEVLLLAVHERAQVRVEDVRDEAQEARQRVLRVN